MNSSSMYIDPSIIGKTYEVTANGQTQTFVCKGYAQNTTMLVIGASDDIINNRTSLHTHKLSEVKFIGKI